MRRNVHGETRLRRHSESANTGGPSGSSAGADQSLREANERWSQAATTTLRADWMCVTSSMNILQTHT